MERILITGGAGSIGIHVIAHICHNTNWEIVLLNSFHHKGYKDRLNRLYQDHPEWKSRIKEFEHNLTCQISPELKERIGHIDYILHLAALSDVFFSVENPVWTIQNNVNSTLTMLEYARQVKPKQFIYFSTDEVYGPVKKGEAHPEWDAHRPSNAYAASKAACEDICHSYWRSYDVPLIITNTMNNFGEMQSSTKYPVIIQKKVEVGETVTIHGDPNKEAGTRFYIHSRNVADALLRIVSHGAKLHKIGELDEPLRYHIVGEKALSNLELAQLVAKIVGKELKYEWEDFHSFNPAHDIHYGLEDNYLKKIGWSAPLSLEESLENTIRWQSENEEWIT